MGVGGQRHALAALPTVKKSGTRCIGGWVGPVWGLDGRGKSRLYREAIPEEQDLDDDDDGGVGGDYDDDDDNYDDK